MADRPHHILICSCEDTMPLDDEAVRRACRGAQVATGRQLCRAELARVQAALRHGQPVTIGCTQEAPLFSDVAAEIPGSGATTFVNVREYAGWSSEANAAGAKMAALIAAA